MGRIPLSPRRLYVIVYVSTCLLTLTKIYNFKRVSIYRKFHESYLSAVDYSTFELRIHYSCKLPESISSDPTHSVKPPFHFHVEKILYRFIHLLDSSPRTTRYKDTAALLRKKCKIYLNMTF